MLAFSLLPFLLTVEILSNRTIINPQPGFQTAFLSSPADIVIGGGAAGAGKSYALLMEPLRHVSNPRFSCVFFRRTTPQIKNPGGLWDTSLGLYGSLVDPYGNRPTSSTQPLRWSFPSGANILFTHLQYDQTIKDWDGAQIPLLCFDELIHFSELQFWYMVGRNRTTCGIRPYVRTATNPQPYGWVKRLIGHWLYPDDHPTLALRGMPILERAGELRYYFKYKDGLYTGQTVNEVLQSLPSSVNVRPELIKSYTFIPGTLADNKVLTEKDPSYEANLYAQDAANSDRLLKGRWYAEAGENDFWQPYQLEDLFTTTWVLGGDKALICDIAMEGSDLFVVGYWDGLRLEKIYTFPKSDGAQILDTIKRLADQHHVPGSAIVFDSNGVGNFLSGFLRNSYDFRSNAKPVEISDSANGKPLHATKQNFDNLRSQCLYKLAELVRDKKIYIADQSFRTQIVEELVPHKKEDKENGSLSATPKQQIAAELGHSPDLADMIIMRMVLLLTNRRRSSLLSPPKPQYG